MNCGFADQSHFTHEFRRHFGRTFLIGWAGIRGVDSLAAALAVPLSMADGVTPILSLEPDQGLTVTNIKGRTFIGMEHPQ